MKKLLLLFIFTFSLFAKAQDVKVRFYDVRTLDDYQKVLLQTIQDEKMMFIVFYQDGDAFYQMQKDNIYANAELAAAYAKTNPMAVSITSEMGSRLAESIGVDSFPSFYYFNNEEVLLVVKEGYQSVSNLIEALKKAQSINTNYSKLTDKYGDGTLTQAEWRTLLETYALNNDFIQTQSLALEFFNSQSKAELLKPENAELLVKYGIDLESAYPELIIKNKASLPSSFDYKAFYSSTYDYNFDRAEVNKDTVLLEKIVSVLIPNRPKDEADTKELVFETRKVFSSETRLFNVWEKAAIERAASLGDDSTKAEFIFEEAFEIADNFNTEDAQETARKLAKESYTLREDYRYKMLEGYMAYLMKDYAEALELVKLAETKTDNANNIRKANSLQKMITKELEKENKSE
ncbi:hypothetical protein Oweho_0342 [Owenweeksia hongkongensis DSM 17368]|uniref:Thioredoxin domain-containing protein n=1 Tax=Owenweeksia hongkongensis (strain DSM 17368 / CIP 108786 / JCM 12287 / NRRL B-23963 / UST20020801) TaxID=926562 RepID=G8R8I1_OWEHD|nr:hypothetical protein [Owenweeksia hongkongensis]AEV31363.1 hypothetical protein Oweho_0342 [Owenweeksia hongkongensis DSM 17368]